MSRPLSFDRNAVIESAMLSFWENGIHATTMNDILAATGLSRSSLHNTFGNKSNLFRLAIERYIAFLISQLNLQFSSSPSFKVGLESLLEEALTCNFNGLGCFLYNCMDHDLKKFENERKVIIWGMNEVFKVFEGWVIKAQLDLEISEEMDAKVITAQTLSTLVGIRNFRQIGIPAEQIVGAKVFLMKTIFAN